MTSLLAGTVAHGARGGRGVSTSHYCCSSPGLSGTPRYSPELPGNGSHNTCNTAFYAIISNVQDSGNFELSFMHFIWFYCDLCM